MTDIEYHHGLTDTHEATVQSSRRFTPETTDEVRLITLSINEPAFYFLAGQTIGVLVPEPDSFGNPFHHRYYTIAQAQEPASGQGVDLGLLVRRCFYIDEVSGEQYPGIASNHLCDARPGDKVILTGPYLSPFKIPADPESNLLMLGTGTGIAPFRAFLGRVYQEQKDWKGKVRLYYGAKTGMDMLYMNDINNDLANYYDHATFRAIQAVGRNLLADEGDALKAGVADHAAEIWKLIQEPKTHVYLAGMVKIAKSLDDTMSQAAGSGDLWRQTKQQLVRERRWSELTYQ
jgi:ferredoxin--NADP+ reductase